MRKPYRRKNPRPKDELTKAEERVYRLVTLGLSNKSIGEELFVCEKTVKFHLTNVYKKIQVKGRADAIANFYTGKLPCELVSKLENCLRIPDPKYNQSVEAKVIAILREPKDEQGQDDFALPVGYGRIA